MSPEEHEATTNSNTVAISELTVIATQTSKDVDKIVTHLDKLIPVHTKIDNIEVMIEKLQEENDLGIRPKTLKGFLAVAGVTLLGFGSWITLEHFNLKNAFSAHQASQEEAEANQDEKIKEISNQAQKNDNQIVYLKGSKLDKQKSYTSLRN